MINTVISAIIFALVFYNWPSIWNWLKMVWRTVTFQDRNLHHPPGDKRNNLDLFGDVPTDKTRDLFDE